MAARQTKPAGDVTGRLSEELAAKHAEEQRLAAAQMSMMTANAKRDLEEGEVDLMTKPASTTAQIAVDGNVLDTDLVEVNEPFAKIRVNCVLDDVTIGHGTNYSFEPGPVYKVPKHVADHLESKGVVWH